MILSTSHFRKFILGNAAFISSHSEYKRVLLTGQLALITFAVCLAYAIYDLWEGIEYAWPIQTSCAALSLVSFLSNRNRQPLVAKILLSIAVNTTVFIFASSEPITTGLYSFYIPICLGALAGFGLEQRKWAILFIVFSLSLCCLSLFARTEFLPATIDDGYVKYNLIANLLTATVASVMILYFLINVNQQAEQTIRQSAEELALKNNELTKLNTELDRFVYSSSHDLRAPLSSLLGLIQLCQLSNDVHDLKHYTQLMKTRVEELDRFIKDIADYSRNSNHDLVHSEVNLKKLIGEVIDSLRYYPGSERVYMELHVSEDQLILTDPTRLRIILSNLISNSYKYRDPSKEKCTVTIHSSITREKTILEIADNGIGIPAERLDRLFTMFYQAHENSVGSGLGLYIVKGTVEKLGGSIRVESTAGIGSRFQMQFPLN